MDIFSSDRLRMVYRNFCVYLVYSFVLSTLLNFIIFIYFLHSKGTYTLNSMKNSIELGNMQIL